MNREKKKELEQLLLKSDNISNVIELFIMSCIQNNTLNFELSKIIIENMLEILKNNNIELDDNTLSSLIFKNGYFVKIINCLSENLDRINDKSVLLIIKRVSELENIKLEDFKCSNSDNSQLVDGVKEYISSINNIPLLSKEEEINLALKIKNGDKEARKVFIQSNLRLVIDIVKKFNGYGLSYLDLIQEGNLALIFAVDRFDVSLGYRFSTFATIIINQKVSRAIYLKGSQIRLPEYINKKIRLLKSTYVSLHNKTGCEVTFEDLSRELGISVEEIEYLYSIQNGFISINNKVNDEGGIEIIDLIPSDDDIEEDYSNRELSEKILLLLEHSKLSDREKNVIMLRYGLIDGNTWKLKKIGNMYGVSGERIRQIEAHALRKIRKSSFLKKVDDYSLKPGKKYNNK